MGLKAASAAVVTPPSAAVPEPRKIENKPAARPEVKGQVAMHAIITGYEVASHLAATLSTSPEKVKETLHTLAAEVAAKVEDYTFKGE